MATKKAKQKLVECFLCEKPRAEEQDDFCSGCEQHICEKCSVNYDMPFGTHDPHLHAEDPLDDEDYDDDVDDDE